MPAAHSMDMMLFAVDRDGHVAAFKSGEAGCEPEAAYLDDYDEVTDRLRVQSERTEDRKQMTLECINPPDLPTPETYTQVVVARGTKLIFVAGQEPEDVHGKLVGRGDFAAQVHQTFANLGRALAASGALPDQVAKITIYVVDYQRDYHYPIIDKARVTLFGDHKPANVVMGVAALSPDYLIEVDAVAVVDG